MNILLVDDEPSVRKILSKFLNDQLGHYVTQCDNGRDALNLFKKSPFPMVLTDIRMPKMDGIELLQSLKALPEGRNSDIVILTGHGYMSTAIEALRDAGWLRETKKGLKAGREAREFETKLQRLGIPVPWQINRNA